MQEFYINKGATLPILQMELINDGRHDFNNIQQYIQNANIYFTMIDIETGVVKIAHQPATVFLKETGGCTEEYYIGYVWKERDTNRVGKYRGEFEIIFNDDLEGQIAGNLLVPIRTELLINIKDGVIKK